jgi:hypothetical protein
MSYVKLNREEEDISDIFFSIRVLHKESTIIVPNLLPTTTIKELKAALVMLLNVPANQQRLIYNGRSLQDQNSLDSYGIKNNVVVHLFPLPIATVAPTQPAVHQVQAQPLNEIMHRFVAVAPAAVTELNTTHLYNNANVIEAGEPVRMWSFILVFTSSMTLFNYCINLVTTGVVGNNMFDTMVNTFDAILSAGGMYIGQLGLDLFNAIDFDKINKFVRLLIVLGTASIILRFFWAADVILEAKELINESKSNGSTDTAADPAKKELSQSDMVAFTIQVRSSREDYR